MLSFSLSDAMYTPTLDSCRKIMESSRESYRKGLKSFGQHVETMGQIVFQYEISHENADNAVYAMECLQTWVKDNLFWQLSDKDIQRNNDQRWRRNPDGSYNLSGLI